VCFRRAGRIAAYVVTQAAEKGFFTLVLGSGEAHFLVLSLFGIGIAVFVLPPRAV